MDLGFDDIQVPERVIEPNPINNTSFIIVCNHEELRYIDTSL